MAIIVLLGAHSLCAESKNDAANFLVDVGEIHLKQGETQRAIHEFSKALLIEPENVRAKEYLAKYDLEEGLYKGINTNSSQIMDLALHVEEYKRKVNELECEKVGVQNALNALELEKEVLMKAHETLKSETSQLKTQVSQLEETVKLTESQHSEKIKEIESIYADQNQKLQDAIAVEKLDASSHEQVMAMPLHYQTEYLAPIEITLPVSEGDVVEKIVEVPTEIPSLEYEQELAALRDNHQQLKTRNAFHLQQQSKLIHVLEDYLQLREDRLNDAKDQLVMKEIDLAQTQHVLTASLDKLIGVHESAETYHDHYSKVKEKMDVLDPSTQEVVGDKVQEEVIVEDTEPSPDPDANKFIQDQFESHGQFIKDVMKEIQDIKNNKIE